MKKIQLISANEWRQGHPMEIGAQPSDMYYARFCTELLREIDKVFDRCEVLEDGRREFALLVGHYVEDVVSGTHVFDSFRRLHTVMYGHPLPFYTIGDDYFDNEVNLLDLKFFIWDHCQKLRGDEAIINPDNMAIEVIAEALFPLVCKAFEEAPEVEALHDFVFDKARYKDFVESKKVLSWLLLNNPITSPEDIFERIHDEMDEHMKHGTSINPGEVFYAALSLHLFSTPCNFLALRANEWLAEMLRTERMDEEAEKMTACRHTGFRHFEIKAADGGFMALEDCETGEQYRLVTDSLDGTSGIAENPIMQCDLATIDGENWETNGISFFSKSKPEKKRFTTDGKPAYDHYMKKLGGHRIAYYKNQQEMQKQLIGNVPVTIDKDIQGRIDLNDNFVVFVNTDGSLNVSPMLAATLPDPANPYFKAIDKPLLLGAICCESIASSEMVHYFHQQGWLDSLALTSSISPERGRELLHGNLDFLMRYFRGGEYKQLENTSQ